MDINEGDVSLGIAKNYSIRTRVIDSSGAGVNAESSRDLALAAGDPLSELVYSPHRGGLGLKCANPRASDNKPFLVWNVGPNTKVWGSRDETSVGADDIIVDRATLLGPLENRRVTTELGLRLLSPRESNGEAANQEALSQIADLQSQKVPDHEATSAAGALNKKETNIPISILAPFVEDSEAKSRISVCNEKGKEIASSDGNNGESCNSVGLLSRGIKRWGNINDVIPVSKRIKNQNYLCSGSTSFARPDSSFIKWISNVVKDFSDSNRQDSSSFPLPLACSIDVNAPNLHIDTQDSASLDTGFRFQSLYCEGMNILNTGEERKNDSIEESKQLIVCDNQAFREHMKYAAEKTFPEKEKFSGSLWVTRLCTKSPRLEKCQEIVEETIGCSTSAPKCNLESGVNVVSPIDWGRREDSQVNQKCSSSNSEVSVDLKSTSKVPSIQKVGGSETMTAVFARRVGAIRHIMPPENNVKNDNQKVPLYNIVSAQNTVSLSKIFRAIQNLRLSRADILRWMNSDVSLSRLNGFFLRLRLRKMDQGIEGASYYVACISTGGDAREIAGCSSNKSIWVDVGGIKSCITSQYVSNHDFLEDEVKDWWCRALDRGCRVPSIDELNSRFNNRTSLGF